MKDHKSSSCIEACLMLSKPRFAGANEFDRLITSRHLGSTIWSGAGFTGPRKTKIKSSLGETWTSPLCERVLIYVS